MFARTLLIVAIVSSLADVNSGQEKKQGSPLSFNFVFTYGVNADNVLNTFNGSFTKDLVCDPDTTVALVLAQADLDSIYRKMVEIDFFNYPESFSPERRIDTLSRKYQYPDSAEFGKGPGELLGAVKDRKTLILSDSVWINIEPLGLRQNSGNGIFSIPLPAGIYSILFQKRGYTSLQMKGVPIKWGLFTKMQIELEPRHDITGEGIADTVEMQTYEPPIIRTIAGAKTPFSTYSMETQIDGNTKNVKWDDRYDTRDPRAASLEELAKYIRRIVESKAEYKALPKARGGYR